VIVHIPELERTTMHGLSAMIIWIVLGGFVRSVEQSAATSIGHCGQTTIPGTDENIKPQIKFDAEVRGIALYALVVTHPSVLTQAL
jgi:hypothetical protein